MVKLGFLKRVQKACCRGSIYRLQIQAMVTFIYSWVLENAQINIHVIAKKEIRASQIALVNFQIYRSSQG